MPIEIPFMNAIFGMFIQFINAHMTIYRNLTPNITKGQKRVKKGSKMTKSQIEVTPGPHPLNHRGQPDWAAQWSGRHLSYRVLPLPQLPRLHFGLCLGWQWLLVQPLDP